MAYEFEIPGRPRALARARRAANGGMYDPESNREAKWLVALAARNAGVRRIDGPVALSVSFWFARPKSHFNSKGLRPGVPTHHVQVPDVDNLVKLLKDALKGIAWRDDAQVVDVYMRKRWATSGVARTMVVIEEMGDEVD